MLFASRTAPRHQGRFISLTGCTILALWSVLDPTFGSNETAEAKKQHEPLTLDEIIHHLESRREQDKDVQSLLDAAIILKRGKQSEWRALCSKFSVGRYVKKPDGGYVNRNDDLIKADIKEAILRRSKLAGPIATEHRNGATKQTAETRAMSADDAAQGLHVATEHNGKDGEKKLVGNITSLQKHAKTVKDQILQQAITSHERDADAIIISSTTSSIAAATKKVVLQSRDGLTQKKWCLDAALQATRAEIITSSNIIARIIDHACFSAESISSRIAEMFRHARVTIKCDLSEAQAVDACGYIAADATYRLREAALAQKDGWFRTPLPDYSQTTCIRTGNEILTGHATENSSLLEVADVNRLVRQYTNLHQNLQASEEWWGGAVSLDNFFSGLESFLAELKNTSVQQHAFRLWVVNTQCQGGSHWFTVAVGQQLQEEDAQLARYIAETTEKTSLASNSGQESCTPCSHEPIGQTPQKLQPSKATTPTGTDHRRAQSADLDEAINGIATLFPKLSAKQQETVRWALSMQEFPASQRWVQDSYAWSEAKNYDSRAKRRKLCVQTRMLCTKEIENDMSAAVKEARDVLLMRLASLQHLHIAEAKKGDTDSATLPAETASKRLAPAETEPPTPKIARTKQSSIVEFCRPARDRNTDAMNTTQHLPDRVVDIHTAWLRLRKLTLTAEADKKLREEVGRCRGFLSAKELRTKSVQHGFQIMFSVSRLFQKVRPSMNMLRYFLHAELVKRSAELVTEFDGHVATEPMHLQTPKTLMELAVAIQGESSSLICPFGDDMEDKEVQH